MSDQQRMTVSEFTKLAMICAEEEGEELCESGVRRFAEQLAERGVLEDEKPKPRRVEVEGAKGLAVGLDDDGDLRLWVDDRDYPLLYQVDVIDDGSRSLKHASALARALALWCGEEQAPDNPPAEDEPEAEPWPYQHIKGDDFDHVKWVTTNAHEHDAHLDSDGDVCVGRNTGRRRECVWISRPALAELAAHFCGTPEEQASPEPVQGTRERPYIWRRRTEDGGTEEVPVWLESFGDRVRLFLSDDPADPAITFINDDSRPMRVPFANSYSGPKDSRGRVLFPGEEPPATQPTPPPEGEVTLRLSREEADTLRALLSNVRITTRAGAAMDRLGMRIQRDFRVGRISWKNGGIVIKD